MEEERQGAHKAPPGRRLTVSKAATELGISAEAVRSRLKRGTLRSVKEASTVYVVLDADRTTDQARPDLDQTSLEHDRANDQTALVESLREQIGYLQGVIATRDRELQSRAEEIRRRDTALEREQELTARFADRLRELEAPREVPVAPQEAEEGPERGPRPDAPGRQEDTRRPWWRRVFGG